MLAFYGEGRFEDNSAVELARGTTSQASGSDQVEVTWELEPEFLQRYLELAGSAGRAWLQVEFTDESNQEKLVLLNPLHAEFSNRE